MSGIARILVVGTLIAFFVVCFFGLALGGSLSRNLTPERGEQCEALATVKDPKATVLEPQNTWSNFGYLIAGALILYRSRNLFGAMVGINLGLEFLFSSLYHAKLTGGLQTIDVAWIYVLLLALILYGVQTLFFPDWGMQSGYASFTTPVLVALGLEAAVIGLGLLMGVLKNSIFESTKTTIILVLLVFGLFVAAAIKTASRLKAESASTSVLLLSIVLPVLLVLAVGFPTLFFKFSDGPGHAMYNWCCPTGAVQSHSGWHILSALLLVVAYDVLARYGNDGRILSWAD